MMCTIAASLFIGASAAPLAPTASPSQILVLGMHHSGTSLVSNLTMMMGAYGGKPEDMLLHPENPLKFWERRDVVALDERRVAAGVQKAAERYEVSEGGCQGGPVIAISINQLAWNLGLSLGNALAGPGVDRVRLRRREAGRPCA